MYRIFLISFLFLSGAIASQSYAAASCIQVIQYAENNDTGECQAFSTPCDVPTGWTPVNECSITTPPKDITPKFEAQKFASCEDMEKKLLTIMKRYESNYWYPSPLMYARDAIMEESVVATPALVTNKSTMAPVPAASPTV